MDARPPTLTRHKLDADAYHRMCDVGILGPDDRTELIGGEVIDLTPISPQPVGWASAHQRKPHPAPS